MARDIELTLMLADYHRTRSVAQRRNDGERNKLSAAPRRKRRRLHAAGVRRVRHRRNVAVLVRDGALPQRAGDRPADLPAAHADPSLHFLLAGFRHRAARRTEGQKDRHGPIPPHGRPVGARHSAGTLRRTAARLPMVYQRAKRRMPVFSCRRVSKFTCANESTEAMLLRGELDALIPPNIVSSFRNKDPRIRRVFKDIRATVNELFSQTQIFPITHTLVVRQELFDKQPWLVASMLKAFNEAEEALPQVLRIRQTLGVSIRGIDLGRRGRSIRQESMGTRPHRRKTKSCWKSSCSTPTSRGTSRIVRR